MKTILAPFGVRALLVLIPVITLASMGCNATKAGQGQAPTERVGVSSGQIVPLIGIRDTTPRCPTCRIVTDSFAVIGGELDTLVPPLSAGIVEGSDGHYYVAPVVPPGRIAVYGPTGIFERLIGRRGEGPGEFSGIFALASTADSGLAVMAGTRLTWVSLAGNSQVSRLIRVPLHPFDVRALPGKNLIASNIDPRLQSLVYLDSSSRNDNAFGEAPKVPPTADNLSEFRTTRWLVPARSDTFWAIPQYFQTQLEVWTIAGKLTRRYKIPAPWYVGYDDDRFREYQKYGVRGAALSRIDGAWRDREGRLWTITTVPDRAWKPSPSTSLEEAHASQGVPVPWGFDRRPVLDAIVAVYSVTDSAVVLLARSRLDAPLSGFLSDSVVYYRAYLDRDLAQFTLYHFRLVQQHH